MHRHGRSVLKISPVKKAKEAWPSIEDKDKPNVANASNAARDLGQGWKVNPYIRIQPGETVTIAEIRRFRCHSAYLDDPYRNTGGFPSSAFTGMMKLNPPWNVPLAISSAWAGMNMHRSSSLAVCVNPGSAFNCYWTMPFRKKCRITMENINDAGSHDPVLPDRLYTYRCSGRCGLFSCPVQEIKSE